MSTDAREIIADALWRLDGIHVTPDGPDEYHRSNADALVTRLRSAGLLLPPGGETIGWEVLTRQDDGTWLADWDALTHSSREAAEQQAIEASAGTVRWRPAWAARVARLVADGQIHEPTDIDASGEDR